MNLTTTLMSHSSQVEGETNSLIPRSVRLLCRQRVKGVFPLKPRKVNLDENGAERSSEPQLTTVTVKKLGIKGWLKGQ